MADVVPKRNLAPESEPWGRSIDKAIADLGFNATKNAQDNSNAFAAINSTMKQISKQINDLNTQQSQIISLINDQVYFDSASIIETNFPTSTIDQDRAVGSIVIPPNYSRALVFMSTYVNCYNSTASGDYLYVKAVISGVPSREMPSPYTLATTSTVASTSKTTLLTGLSGGSISVGAKVHSMTSNWSISTANRAYVEAFAVFLR